MRNLYYSVVLPILVCFAVHLTAQNESLYQNYIVHPSLMNVGRTGFEGHELILDYNNRWQGFGGSARVASAYYNGPVGKNISLGGLISSEKIGSYNNFRAQLNYAYKVQFTDALVSFGLGTGYNRRGVNSAILVSGNIDPDDPFVTELADGIDLFEVSLGAHAKIDDLYFGLSIPSAFRARLDNEVVEKGNDSAIGFGYFLGYVGYDYDFSDYNFSIEPSLYVKKGKYAPLQVDINGLLKLKDDSLVGGFSYSLGEANGVSILLGTQKKTIGIFYSYRVALQEFQRYSNGSHEVSFAVDLGKTQKAGK